MVAGEVVEKLCIVLCRCSYDAESRIDVHSYSATKPDSGFATVSRTPDPPPPQPGQAAVLVAACGSRHMATIAVVVLLVVFRCCLTRSTSILCYRSPAPHGGNGTSCYYSSTE